jgi:hypothetical protein
MNRIALMSLSAVLALSVGSSALAQSRPDANYPNPSGQDSKPNTTPPKKSATESAPQKPSSNPRQADPSQDNGAGKQTYEGNTGKKMDTSPGCSTPTDARSPQTQAPRTADSATATNPQSKSRNPPVCTTSGGDSATKPRR